MIRDEPAMIDGPQLEEVKMTTDLLPCPFCGLSPELGIVDATKFLGVYRLVHRCRVVPPFSVEAPTAERLAERWNTRAPIDRDPKSNEVGE